MKSRPPLPSGDRLAGVTRAAARYGRKHKNRFPWRRTRVPYRVFAAEFFLQRTGATQATSVYRNFIKRFPSLRTLLHATRPEVLTLLKPLGLNHRAVAFSKALEEIRQKHRGAMPSSLDALQGIFGVGAYTARATLCFSRGKRVGIIDPNVVRVVSRVFGIRELPSRPRSWRYLWEFADALIGSTRCDPRFVNWGLLDIGRDLCRPKNPRCSLCFLRMQCDFHLTRAR